MIHSAHAGVKAAARTAPRIGVPFAPIPLDVASRRDVTPAGKLIFATLANQARMRRGEVSSLTNRQISNRAGLSVAAVRRGLDQLESVGLVRRIFGPSKRIRLGVAVTYRPLEGVAHQAQPPADGVAHQQQPGCSASPKGGCAPGAADLLRSPQEPMKTPIPPSRQEGEDAALRVASGPDAARYLRLCIEAGRRGEPMPPAPTEAPSTPRDAPTPRPGPTHAPKPDRPARPQPGPAATPIVPPTVAIRDVQGMVRNLAEGLRAPDVGRRRVGPAKLARQLAELRRRHGRR